VGWYAWLAAVPLVLRRSPRDLLMGAAVLAQVAYVVYIGGDRFDFRFLVPVMGPFFWLVCEAVVLITKPLGDRQGVGALAIVAVLAGSIHHTSWNARGLILEQIEQIRFIRKFAERRAQQGRILRKLVDNGKLPADVRLAVGAAGALPYFARLHAMDVFGLNDREIAMLDVKRTDASIPAHEKHATPQMMVDRKIEMFDATGWMVSTRRRDATDAWVRSLRKSQKWGGRGMLRPVCHKTGNTYLVRVCDEMVQNTIDERRHRKRERRDAQAE
jgi:hypothetical protein